MEWQPIETAPKDGSKIIVARIGDQNFITMAFWDTFYQGWCEKGDLALAVRPTHWMPLPQPPKEQG